MLFAMGVILCITGLMVSFSGVREAFTPWKDFESESNLKSTSYFKKWLHYANNSLKYIRTHVYTYILAT